MGWTPPAREARAGFCARKSRGVPCAFLSETLVLRPACDASAVAVTASPMKPAMAAQTGTRLRINPPQYIHVFASFVKPMALHP